MRAPISVIIPTLNADEPLAECCAALMEGVHAGLVRELVVSDGGSSDNTAEVAGDLGATWVEGPASRGGQIARGIAASSGPWLLILHADSHLDSGWCDPVTSFIDRNDDKAAYFRLRFRSQGVAPAVVGFWARLRSRVFGLPYGDQGLLISRSLLAEVGGVPNIPLMEDVALARALKRHLVALPHGISTSAERYERDGWIHRSLRNFGILSRYLAGADPQALAERYRG